VNRTARIDLAIAAAVAVIVWIISPGYAISGVVAIIVVIVCSVAVWRERHAFPAPSQRRDTRRTRR
jgi:fatty acid desaturase